MAEKYFTGKPCKNGHISERYASTYACVECISISNHSKKHVEQVKKWNESNSEKTKEYGKKWYKTNKGKKRKKNLEARVYTKRAKPKWADDNKISQVYELAAEIRKNGQDVHVDHIIPLRGKKVSGLHVENNLQIIPAQENLKKGNGFSINRIQ